MKEAIILFTRVPIPGKTKTRLETYLTGEMCAKLHINFLKDIYGTCKNTGKSLFIFYTPGDNLGILEDILGENNNYYPQIGDKLGDKMFYAINTILKKGYKSCVLIGSDIPEISENDLEDAFKKLKNVDIVLGPTFDMGYYLVGMKTPYKTVSENKVYGMGNVLDETIEKIKKSNLTFSLTNKHLDIDEKEDLLILKNRLENEGEKCFYTREFLKTL